jgi:pyruvate dehydrogenase E2 component (dihydrolipoamide acetyltransferase)
VFPDGRQQHHVEPGAYDGPVLVVWGEQDRVIPVAHARAAPAGYDTQVLAGAGHSPLLESAGEFNRIVEGFLAGAR